MSIQRWKRPIDYYISKNIITGCWNWLGCIEKSGYGRYRVNKRSTLAHRYIYELHKGTIPEGLFLDHLCENKSCVNPDHLEPVTRLVNTRRYYAKPKSER